VLDVGCGTGIAARQFQAAGCAVLGVDPDERMAAYARERGLEVEVSTFETWEPAGRTFDVARLPPARPGASRTSSSGGWTGPGRTPAKSGSTCSPPPGGLTRLPADRQAEILDAVGTAIDARGGSFTTEFVTLCATGLRRETP